MRRARFPSAFAAALSAHAALVFVLALAQKARGPETAPGRPPQELVVVDEEILPAPPSPAEAHGAARTNAIAPRGPLAASASPARAEAARGTGAPLAPEPQEVIARPAGSAEGWSFSSRAPVDLGVGAYWKSVALAGSPDPPRPSEPPPAPAPSAPDRLLRESLNARDLELGLARGGPLVAAAHEAASLAIAPDTGSATFDVESDEAGRVMAANLVSSNGNAPAWGDVARELVSLMASKRLRVRPGAHGLRTRLRIIAERTLPSGEQSATSAGAVPDDVPGADPVCVGTGWFRKCTAGLPVGTTRSLGDVTNIGAKRARVVRAQILGEATL